LGVGVVIITGVSPNSLGAAMAMAIARQSPSKLFLASRTLEKVEKVIHSIKQAFPLVNVEAVLMDLSSQQSIRMAARQIASTVEIIDVLINNAGVMVLEKRFTAENIELQFGTNHIGHFLLTHLLMEPLKEAARRNSGATRVVNVTSEGHRLSPIRFNDYNIDGNKEIPVEEQPPPMIRAVYQGSTGYNGWLAYGQSKTANILFSLYLSEQSKGQGIVSYAVHPGCKSFNCL
jgi:NAD(P)-dependent dehydrogenase (short-subunit alcohol dehydrogenase family)